MINGITSAEHGRIPLARRTFTLMALSGEMAMICKQDTWLTMAAFLPLVSIKTVMGAILRNIKAFFGQTYGVNM